MESYGAILKKAREDKSIDFETIERETTITKQYLEAMETEDESVFPGEPYLVGFLRNYADYLGVDYNEVLKLYHAKKLQESPIPEGLIQKQKPSYLVPVIVIVSVVVAVLIAFAIYFFVFKMPEMKTEQQQTIERNTKKHQYMLTSKGETKRLYKGDQILVPSKDTKDSGNIILTIVDTLGSLTIATPSGNQIVDLSEERDIDVNGDGMSEIIIYLSDISATDSARGAEVRMLLKENAAEEAQPVIVEEIAPVENTASSSVKNNKQTQILEDTRAYPFTVNISFRGACVFRYGVDRKENIEDYFVSGDIVNVTASNGIRLWMSNVNALKIQVIANSESYDLEVGKAGQVKAEDIKWVKDSDGKYKLVVIELD
ncbi:MAG: helix-turn-helix transcriptional regulator [Treponema sp.]